MSSCPGIINKIFKNLIDDHSFGNLDEAISGNINHIIDNTFVYDHNRKENFVKQLNYLLKSNRTIGFEFIKKQTIHAEGKYIFNLLMFAENVLPLLDSQEKNEVLTNVSNVCIINIDSFFREISNKKETWDIVKKIICPTDNNVKTDLLEEKNKEEYTLLNFIVKVKGVDEIRNYIVEKSPAETFIIANNKGNVPLHSVIIPGQDAEIIMKVIEKSPPEAFATKNKDGNIPLHSVIMPGQNADVIIKIIEQSGENAIFIENNDGNTPLHLMVSLKDIDGSLCTKINKILTGYENKYKAVNKKIRACFILPLLIYLLKK